MLESPGMCSKKGSPPRLFLASNSPRRRELLSLCGWEYSTLAAQVDETPIPGEEGIDYVQRLARDKAIASADRVSVDGVIIAADTTVVNHRVAGKDRILGKPRNPDEAAEMLRDLRDSTHQVHTALAILSTWDGCIGSDLCTTNVTMRSYSDEEIEKYVQSGDPMDKAGAYAIQHAGFHPVEGLDGCFANVMGLPLCHLVRSLRPIGIVAEADVPRACQLANGYDCPIYHQILIEKL
jgi:MAF protein